MSSNDYSFFKDLGKYSFVGIALGLLVPSLLRTANILVVSSESVGGLGFFSMLLGVYVSLNLTVLKEFSIIKKLFYPLFCFIGFPLVALLSVYSFAKLRLE